jgi:hypothetical protein
MKTYRLLNTEAGELPVVGDEVLQGMEWNSISEIDLKYYPQKGAFYVIRRELHPQEMAKEIAHKLAWDWWRHSGADDAHEVEEQIQEELLPHIQAALVKIP